MNNKELRNQEILRLKEILFDKYNYLMSFILLFYTIIFLSIMPSKIIGYYCMFGTVFIMCTTFIFKILFPRVSIENRLRYCLITAPLYVFFLIFYFWDYSIINLCWLVPIPFGAYIFLGKKGGINYSIYAFIILIIICVTANFFSFHDIKIPYEKIRYTDISVIIFNMLIIFLFVYYKSKIKELQIISVIEEKEQITLPIKLNDDDISNALLLFEDIESEMISNKLFTHPDLSISVLSTALKVSNNYISKAIRLHGHPNFNSYVNLYRINLVKKLIDSSDLKKVTLMYIYTEAGFTSQSTFNRAFKQFEGITPSQYIQQIKNNS